jgi:hypothetical protein
MIVRKHDSMTFTGEAWYSDCETYRYLLRRRWSAAPQWLFIGCNPSTATEQTPDATITRMCIRAETANAGGLTVCNVHALRSTDPNALIKAEDPTGSDNLDVLRRMIAQHDTIVCGWGNHRAVRGQAKVVLALIRAQNKVPLAININADGSPAHPLYQSYARQPMPLPEAA